MKKKKNSKKKNDKLKYKNFLLVFSIILFISGIYLIYSLVTLNIIKIFYIVIIGLILLLISAILVFIYIKGKSFAFKIPFIVFGVLLISLETFASYNIVNTSTFIDKVVSTAINEENFNIYVKSDFDEKKDAFKNLNLGVLSMGSENMTEALEELKKEKTFKSVREFENIEEFISAIRKGNIEVMFLTSSMMGILTEEYPELSEEFKLYSTITISYEESVSKGDVDVTKEPFIIYLSGIDTYGTIGTVSRSDVNMLAVVNPMSSEILLINTPRDYYVMLHSKKAMDKLTHAGIYGIDESLKTLEDLYSVDIDFYIKVNFSSLIKIVDSLGGIDVNSKYSFSYDGYTFKKGMNKLNGKAALAFSRCRKELPNGDISRGENQQAVISAIIEKIASPSIISKYTSILSTLSKSFVTNMTEEDIFKLGKYQLSNNPSWSINSVTANGTGTMKPTYSMGSTKLYVMVPNDESIKEIKAKIDEATD